MGTNGSGLFGDDAKDYKSYRLVSTIPIGLAEVRLIVIIRKIEIEFGLNSSCIKTYLFYISLALVFFQFSPWSEAFEYNVQCWDRFLILPNPYYPRRRSGL